MSHFFFAQSAEPRSCQREREREREKKTAVHARRHTAASQQRGCFLWGCSNRNAGIRSSLFLPCFWLTRVVKISLHVFSIWNICYDYWAAPLDSPQSLVSPVCLISKLVNEEFFIDLSLAVSYQAKDSRGGFGIFCFSMGSFLLERVVLWQLPSPS